MARALSSAVDGLTVVVNVGDDDYMYGAHIAADLDTVTYTLAGIEGPHGWGLREDTFNVMEALAARGIDTTFRLGDRDLATCLMRTEAIRRGEPLSLVTARIASSLGVHVRLLPASDDRIRTIVQRTDGSWQSFQEYFVLRGHEDEVAALRYDGIDTTRPAPGVLDAIAKADLVAIAPSNPPLSIWPIIDIHGVRDALADARKVVAVSPLFGGMALKGPADRVLASLGFPAGTAGILEAYSGLLDMLVVDSQDEADEALATPRTEIVATNTHMSTRKDGERFGAWLMDTMFG
jgi:LPPG:FO 2-phospho-L-lactate transferase